MLIRESNQEQDLESRQGWDLRNLNPTVCRGRGQIEIPSKSAFASLLEIAPGDSSECR